MAFLNTVFASFGLPRFIPTDLFIKNPEENTLKNRYKTSHKISEGFTNMYILSVDPDLSIPYIFVWIIYGLGSLTRWCGRPWIGFKIEKLRDVLFGVGIFDLMFIALVEMNGNKKGVDSLGKSMEGLSVLVSWINVMLITLNLALITQKASEIRKMIVVKDYRNRETGEIH